MKNRATYIVLLCMLLSGACKEDNYVYPNVLTEFIDAQTDENGTLTHLITDKGEIYNIQEREGLGGLVADTVYRSVSIYEPLTDNTGSFQTVKLYQCRFILAQNPVPPSSFKDGIKTDPADIERIWRSGNYLNMILQVKIKDEKHTYHFIDEGIKEENGIRILDLRLYHDNRNDYEAYTHQVYLSVPLTSYRDQLKEGDKIRFSINTYNQGIIQKTFDF